MIERLEKIIGIALSKKQNGGHIDIPLGMSLEEYASAPDMKTVITPKDTKKAEATLETLENNGFRFIPCTSPDYPTILIENPEHPVGIYMRSTKTPKELFSPGYHAAAIVGTRDISPYGKHATESVIGYIYDNDPGCTIISGLALGVDYTAHRTALGHAMTTIAVLPTGINTIYPTRHQGLADDIVRAGGALITAFHPDTGPIAINFLIRNRLMVALSDTVIVTESKEKGSGMMTARLAYDFDKDVYAIPGRINDIRSAGCNQLIKERTAQLLIP